MTAIRRGRGPALDVQDRKVMRNLWLDVRYGFRQLRKSPGFAVVAIGILALGIGANSAVFTVMNAVMLRSLPVPNPRELVYLHTTGWPDGASQTGYSDMSLNEPSFANLRGEHQVLSDLMAFVPLGFDKVSVRLGDQTDEVQADMVSGNFFRGLGVKPARGRTFVLKDEQDHAHVAVASYAYWTRRFSRNPGVIGETIFIKGLPFTIVGVADSDFTGLEPGKSTDLWIPLQSTAALTPWGSAQEDGKGFYGSPTWWFLMTVGRLQPEVTPKQASARLNPIFQRSAYAGVPKPNPKEHKPELFLSQVKGMEGLREQYELPLTVLTFMVALVLLIACSNIAMLLMARNSTRQREFSVRMALGAGRGRLFTQLLIESLILVVAGAALGWIFAVWATRALAAWSSLDVSLAPDRNVLLFTAAISLLAGLLFGLAPLLNAVRVPIALALKTSSATSNQNRGKSLSGQTVLAGQMCICMVLLVAAGLLVRTLGNLEKHNLGMRTGGLLVFGIDPSKQEIPTDAAAVQFYRRVVDRFRRVPGVESVTLMQNRLGSGWSNNTTAYVDGVAPKSSDFMRWNAVGSDYFHVLGVPLLQGRDFTDADSETAAQVAVVNATFAKEYLPKQNPLGHRFSLDRKASKAYTIIGVAADSNYTSVRETARPMAYMPYPQVPGIGELHCEVRVHGNSEAALPALRDAIRKIDPNLALLRPVTQQEQFESSFSAERMFARLSLFFGLLAVLLVAIGLYGTLAYRVSRRTAEIGVRMAVGAQRGQVLWMILREGMILAALGVAVGVPVAYAAARLLRSVLFGIEPFDFWSFAGALAGVIVVTLAASFLPARRAASVEPITALRAE